jgi:ketosteroid isomerase-like protein
VSESQSTSERHTPSAAARAMTDERLLEALDAWNHHDVELVLQYMAPDCAYHASFGPELLGKSYRGREEVREGVGKFFRTYPDGTFVDTEVSVDGDHGFSEWTFVVPSARLEVHGCDLFEFEGDLIKTKNAFRKSGE